MERKLTFVVAAIIAVVVVATISVYVSMQPSGPRPVTESPRIIIIFECNTTHVLVLNGFRGLAIQDADVHDESGLVAYIDFSHYPLESGETDWVPLNQSLRGGPLLTDSYYSENEFWC